MTTGIYKLTSPKGHIYIGQAKDIRKRFTRYFTKKIQAHPRLFRCANEYGIENFKFEIIHECQVSELNHWERNYQDLYDVCGENGLNCKLTKTTDKKSFYIQETIDRLRLNASRPFLGKKLTNQHKENISKGKMGHTYNLGQKRTEEFCDRMKELGKRTAQRLICNESGVIYNSINDCSITLRVKRSDIHRSLKAGFSANGLTFSKIDENGNTIIKNNKPILSNKGPKIAKKIMCVETGKIFDSLNLCSIELIISCGSLSSHIRHGFPKAVKGNTFRYLTEEEKYSVPYKKRHKKSSLSTLSRLVINLESGVFYDSLKLAADAHGFKYQTLYCMLSGQNPNRTSLIYA